MHSSISAGRLLHVNKAKQIKINENLRDNNPLRNSHNLNRIRSVLKNLDCKDTQMTLGC